MMRPATVVLTLGIALVPPAAPAAEAGSGDPTALDAAAIGEAAGTEASVADDGVVRIGWSREVPVVVDGFPLDPAAGFGSWAAFTPLPDDGALVMGDTVVFRDEVDAAMDAAFAADLEVTALHNHFFYDEPKAYFMHIEGRGTPGELARGVGEIWDAIRAVRDARPRPAEGFGPPHPSPDGTLDADRLAEILGYPATDKGSVVKVTAGRSGSMDGARIGASMGLTTWAAFAGDDALATVDGDFIMTAGEVQPVLRALRRAGLHVVALHNHMIGGEPVFYFAHYWGKGPAPELARGVRSALDAQETAGPASP